MRLVVDWDGTCTEIDGLHMIIERFGDRQVFERMEGVLGDGRTLHEVIGTEIGTITAPLHQVAAWVAGHVQVRQGFHELARRHRPLIVSSGFRELIEPVLRREGVELEVVANSLDPRPGGWLPLWLDESVCTVCGEACKRGVLAGAPFVYAGDGYSDRCAALGAARVFARDGLARWLDERGAPYEPFDELGDIVSALA